LSGDTPAPPAPSPARSGRDPDGRSSGFAANLARRVGTALVALPPLLAALLLGPPLLGVLIVAAAVAIGALEYFRLLEARQLEPFRLCGVVLLASVFLDVTYAGHPGPPLAPAGTVALLLAVLGRRERAQASIPAAAATALGALYLGGLGGTIGALRAAEPSSGGWRVVLMLAILMGADTFAFFAGQAAGRRPLAPSISPAKTVEGAMGALVGGVAGALIIRILALSDLPLAHGVLLGAAVAALGMAGDLVESAIKRWAGVKDSGRLFPGHGGMLDRLDSLLFGAPVLYYYFLFPR
jgi:phosphatidate cytidylyltransferase